MTGISIFDVDRTLTRLPTYSAFLIHAARATAPWRLLLLPAILPAAIGNLLKLVGRRRLKEVMHAVAIGRRLPRADAMRVAHAFAEQVATRGLYPQALALIERERAAGRRIILASAAPALYTRLLAERLGIRDVVASEESWADDRLLPRIAGENCYGPAKQARLVAHLAAEGIDRAACHLRFYTDHASDLPTLEWVDEPVAVNPSPRLRRLAEARGWPILDWRRRG